MSKMPRKKTLQIHILVTGFLILSIIQVIYLQLRVGDLRESQMNQNDYNLGAITDASANAIATTLMCINYAPSDITYSCNRSIPWGYGYECTLGVIDYNSASGNYTYNSTFITGSVLFNITQGGVINFTPDRSDIGNHTLGVYVYDDSGCDNNMYYEEFELEIVNASHPPVLIANLTNQSIFVGNAYSFFLNNYFLDPDGGRLDYVSSYNGSYVSVIILNNSFTTIRGTACGDSLAYFVATDLDNETATSNTVKYTVYGCPQTTPSSGGSGGGGGGGGGGRISNCNPNWKCGRWGRCLPNGTQVLECRDYNGCDPDHYIENFYKNCTYVPEVYVCQEQWICSNWTECINDTHTRVCFDNRSCGTNNTKPAEIENCFLDDSCANGIQDNDETGIDCGGSCKPCPEKQSPAQIVKRNTGLILAVLLTVLAVFGSTYMLRHKIKNWYVSLKSKKHKRLYINLEQKERLMKSIEILQERIESASGKSSGNSFANSSGGSFQSVIPMIKQFSIDYFKELLGLENPTRDDIIKNLPVLCNKNLEELIKGFYDAMLAVYLPAAPAAIKIPKDRMQALIDEMRYNVFLISEFTDNDAAICPKVRLAPDNAFVVAQCYTQVSNILLALIFEEYSEAEKQYKALLEIYSKATIDEKKEVYGAILRVYNYIIVSQKILYQKR